VITLLAELLARPGQSDSAIDGWIWISLIPLVLSVIFPIAGHAVEERDKTAERKGEQQLADEQAQLMPASDGESPPRAVRVADAQPRRFGVHRPIEVAGATSDRPAYVLRDTDCEPDGVRAAITTVARDSGLVVVVGDSSSGKTRTLLEAVTAEVPDWQLVHPGTVVEIGDLADGAPTQLRPPNFATANV
jgi:hypothetical protein